jgi:hypothetical protein
MRPTRNKVFCKDCERTKILFETEKKADNFIKFNYEEIEVKSGYSPQRSYYCLFCGGWHITSIKVKIGLSRKEQMFEQYRQEITSMVNQEIPSSKRKNKIDNQIKRNKVKEGLESQIKEMDVSQKEKFFTENATSLNKEIEQLLDSNSSTDKQRLKELRQNLEILNILKKQNGFQKINTKLEKRILEAKEKKIEEWRLWSKNLGY